MTGNRSNMGGIRSELFKNPEEFFLFPTREIDKGAVRHFYLAFLEILIDAIEIDQVGIMNPEETVFFQHLFALLDIARDH